jgi:hypothetical protein
MTACLMLSPMSMAPPGRAHRSLSVRFSFHVLAVPGRRSAQLRATPVSPFSVDGQRFILSFGRTDWVRNARAAGWGFLSRGRQRMRVALVEVEPPDSAVIVREFPRQIPAGVQFFVRLGLVEAPGGPDQFQAAADRLALFQIKPLQTPASDRPNFTLPGEASSPVCTR